MSQALPNHKGHVKTLTYNKPEVVVLGEAARIIQANKLMPGVEFNGSDSNPAYELDE